CAQATPARAWPQPDPGRNAPQRNEAQGLEGLAMIVDCAHYKSGARQHEGPMSIADAASCASGGDGFVWVGIHDPPPEELDEIATRFPLHDLSVEDARHVHQRAKIERYERHYFVVLRTAHYDEKRGEVVFGEIHIFAGRGFAIT